MSWILRSFYSWLSMFGLPSGTPPPLRAVWRALSFLAVALWLLGTAGAWLMPVRPLLVTVAAAITTSVIATVCWVSALGYHRDKRLLIDALAAELAAGPEPDPSHLMRVA